jgi:hypothetical protein
MLALYGALLAVGIAIVLLLDEQPSLAPDSAYYLDAGAGTRVPIPFAYRWFLPAVLGTVHSRWRVVTFLSIVIQGAALAVYAQDLRAVVLVGLLPALWRFNLRHPVLVDAPALATALCGAAAWTVLPHTWPTLALLVMLSLVAGGMRETAPVWTAIYCGSPWPLIGLLAVLPGALRARAVDPGQDNLWICHPVESALKARRRHWLAWQMVVVPWGVLLPLAVWHSTPRVWLALAVGHLPWLATSDWNRIAAWAAPVLAITALSWQSDLWPLLLLIHVFNPYRGA